MKKKIESTVIFCLILVRVTVRNLKSRDRVQKIITTVKMPAGYFSAICLCKTLVRCGKIITSNYFYRNFMPIAPDLKISIRETGQ